MYRETKQILYRDRDRDRDKERERDKDKDKDEKEREKEKERDRERDKIRYGMTNEEILAKWMSKNKKLKSN